MQLMAFELEQLLANVYVCICASCAVVLVWIQIFNQSKIRDSYGGLRINQKKAFSYAAK